MPIGDLYRKNASYPIGHLQALSDRQLSVALHKADVQILSRDWQDTTQSGHLLYSRGSASWGASAL